MESSSPDTTLDTQESPTPDQSSPVDDTPRLKDGRRVRFGTEAKRTRREIVKSAKKSSLSPSERERWIRRAKMAILSGFGVSGVQAAEQLQVTRQTLYKDIDDDPDFHRQLTSFAAAAREEFVNAEIGRRKNSMTAEQKIHGLFARSFKITEKIVERTEQMMEKAEASGDKVTVKELLAIHAAMMEVHEKITVWASKFAASEAPKKVQMSGTVNHEHTVVISDELVDSLLAFQSHMRQHSLIPAQPLALNPANPTLDPASVIDVEHQSVP